MRTSDAADLLSRTLIFGALDPGSLATVAAEGHERRFKKGAAIFYQGDPSAAFYVVASGSAKVFVSSSHGEEMVLTTVRPPETLGEVAIFDAGPHSASAEALESTTLFAFARDRILDLAERDQRVMEALLRAAGTLLRRLTLQAADLVFLDLEGRVAKVLADGAELRGHEKDGAIVLDLGLTQSELGAMVGGSRQSVNQILGALAARGFLEMHGREVRILDPAALRTRAGM